MSPRLESARNHLRVPDAAFEMGSLLTKSIHFHGQRENILSNSICNREAQDALGLINGDRAIFKTLPVRACDAQVSLDLFLLRLRFRVNSCISYISWIAFV